MELMTTDGTNLGFCGLGFWIGANRWAQPVLEGHYELPLYPVRTGEWPYVRMHVGETTVRELLQGLPPALAACVGYMRESLVHDAPIILAENGRPIPLLAEKRAKRLRIDAKDGQGAKDAFVEWLDISDAATAWAIEQLGAGALW